MSGVEVVSRPSAVEAAHRRMAEAHLELDRVFQAVARAFQHYTQAQAQLAELKHRDERIMDPVEDAAYQAWRRGPRDVQIELAAIGPAPMMDDDQ